MPSLEYPTYLDHIRRESARFREALTGCDPQARVPTCPDWDAGDLLWHLTGVQRFWSDVVRLRPAGPDDPRIVEEGTGERPDSWAGLLAAFDEHSAALVTALEQADPDDEAWHWSEDRRVGTSHRRQAHEALIHRVDAELTAGVPVTPLDPALADDGVAEVLGVMYGGAPAWGAFTPSGEAVAVRMEDTGTDLLVTLGSFSGTDPDSGRSYSDEPDIALVESGPAPVVTISGTAGDLDAWLWKRGPADRVRVEGDRLVHEKLAAILDQPLT